MNNITLYHKSRDSDGIIIIEKESTKIIELIKDLDLWHEELSQIILNPNSLYYYATNNYDSEYYLENLSEDNILDIQSALQVIIKNPYEFYESYKQKSYYYNKVTNATTIDELKDIVVECDLKDVKTDKKTLEQIKNIMHRRLNTDYCYGIFGEILFYNVVENILSNTLLISKVQLITAPNTNAHGSDGVFCDEESKVLYFGEAKFTSNLGLGIKQALNSMESCLDRINLDKSFILSHQRDIKNGYGKLINRSNIDDYKCSIIIFLLHGQEINNEKIISEIENYKNKFLEKTKGIGITIISFPIYDKEHLKNSIGKGIEKYGN